MFAGKIERRGEYEEAFRKCIAIELDVERLADRRAAAVRADEIAAGHCLAARRRFDGNVDAVVMRRDGVHGSTERHFRVRKRLEPLKTHPGDLVLLALHDKRIRRVVLEDSVVEFGDYAAGRPIPELECPRDQALPDDIIEHAQSRDHLERCGMQRRCTRRFVHRLLGLEHTHRHTTLGERQRCDDADGATAGNQDGTGAHPALYCCLTPAAATASAQTEMSLSSIARYSAGVSPSGSAP